MSTHLTDDLFVALALEEVGSSERERLSAHLAGCAACRAEYDAVEDAVRHTLAAAPAIAPPAGFSGRVVAAMGLEPDDRPIALTSLASRRPSRTPWLAVAASVLVGAGIGAAATLGVLGLPAEAPAPSPTIVPTAAPAASGLVTRTGETVGSAGLAMLDGRRVLVLAITRGKPGMAYDCQLVRPDGSRASGGTWTLDASYGETEASGTWIVPVDVDPTRVELVAPNGNVWASADF